MIRNRKKATTTKLMSGVDHEADRDAGVADVEADVGEVRLAEDGRDDRVDHAVRHRLDDLLEVERHDQPDGDGDHVTLVDEALELVEVPLH